MSERKAHSHRHARKNAHIRRTTNTRKHEHGRARMHARRHAWAQTGTHEREHADRHGCTDGRTYRTDGHTRHTNAGNRTQAYTGLHAGTHAREHAGRHGRTDGRTDERSTQARTNGPSPPQPPPPLSGGPPRSDQQVASCLAVQHAHFATHTTRFHKIFRTPYIHHKSCSRGGDRGSHGQGAEHLAGPRDG